MPQARVLLLGVNHTYQWLESTAPTPLEREQRSKFTERIRGEVQQFQPNIIADETPDTDNADLLAALPAVPIPVDITDSRKQEHGLNIQRSIHFVCPFVDSIRERYWRLCLHRLSKRQGEPRVLMFVGAHHLEPCFDRISFPDLLVKGGYAVTTVDLYKGPEWDHSWIHDWRHPVTPSTGSPPTLRCCVATGSYQRDQRCEHKIYWKNFPANKEQLAQ
jgi:hypothetical protein